MGEGSEHCDDLVEDVMGMNLLLLSRDRSVTLTPSAGRWVYLYNV